MVGTLSVAGLALRAGLRMRRLRQRGAPRDLALLRRHLRLAKPAVALCGIGFVAGPLSSLLLRDWTPFQRLHGWLGLLAATLFLTAFLLGRRLARDREGSVEAHAWAGLLAVLVAGAAAIAGFVLLP